MVAQSRLHVPKTPARPGDAPDFSYLKLSPAGKIARPDVAGARFGNPLLSRKDSCACSTMSIAPSVPGIRNSMPKLCAPHSVTCC